MISFSQCNNSFQATRLSSFAPKLRRLMSWSVSTVWPTSSLGCAQQGRQCSTSLMALPIGLKRPRPTQSHSTQSKQTQIPQPAGSNTPANLGMKRDIPLLKDHQLWCSDPPRDSHPPIPSHARLSNYNLWGRQFSKLGMGTQPPGQWNILPTCTKEMPIRHTFRSEPFPFTTAQMHLLGLLFRELRTSDTGCSTDPLQQTKSPRARYPFQSCGRGLALYDASSGLCSRAMFCSRSRVQPWKASLRHYGSAATTSMLGYCCSSSNQHCHPHQARQATSYPRDERRNGQI